MSSRPHSLTSAADAGAMPFASYAQVLRMLMPAASRIGFYDAQGKTLWVSDGVEEPEFRMHLDVVLGRFATSRPDQELRPYGATEHSQPIFVFPVSDAAQLIGAVGLVCRELPATAAYRRLEHVERLLAPFMQILTHAWRATRKHAPTRAERTEAIPPLTLAPAADASAPLPAMLRRNLVLATRALGCSFGALFAAERPFTLHHRVTPDESDVAVTAAIDSVRNSVLKHVRARLEPVFANQLASSTSGRLPYKLLALPLLAEPQTVAAVLVLFRDMNAADFDQKDLAAIAQIGAQIPASALKELLAPPAQRAPVEELRTATGQSDGTPHTPRTANAPFRPPREQPPALGLAAQSQPAPAMQPSKVVRFAGMRSDMPMSERVRLALANGAFDLYAQRIAPLKDTQRAERFEVLVRLNDGHSLYTPQAFFAAAEAHELLPELDQWVIRELMTTLKQKASTLRTKCWEFAVNVAAQTLLTDEFTEYVIDELKHSAIPPGLLVFEVAERDAIEHQYSLSILANRLHGVGCRIALDNCRAGLRTFDTLQKWPVSCFKIDGSLVRHIVNDWRYESQVRAMAQMAADMGLETVAECVETERIRDSLLSMRIDYAQGYHFGRPEPLAALFAA